MLVHSPPRPASYESRGGQSIVHSKNPARNVLAMDHGLWTMDRNGIQAETVQWRILVDETQHSAAGQMALDRALAEAALPTVRLFRWNPPAVSLGWKQLQPEWLGSRAWATAGCEIVERPTSGGVAFHGSDLSISVTVPRTETVSLRALMDAVCQSAVHLCRSYGADASSPSDAPAAGRIAYCLTDTSPYAVLIGGRKIAGFALRRFPHSWLIQGSLLVHPLPDMLAKALPRELLDSLHDRAIALSEAATEMVKESAVAQRWAASWSAWWCSLGVETPKQRM